MAGYSIKQFIEPFTDRPIAEPSKTIGQVLEYTNSSHRPIYVFDNDKFMGVVSAYQTLYHTYHAPYTKKVVSEIKKTPQLTKKSSLYEIIRSMRDTRLYELPVLDKNGNILGVVTAEKIMNAVINDEMISTYLVDCIEIKSPISRPHKGTIKDVFHLVRTKGISRIILTDSKGKVDGIVTRSDIKTAFIRPTPRQRFRGLSEKQYSQFFDEEEIYREDDPIERYSTTNVFTLPDSSSKREVIKKLIESEFKSVVLVDAQHKPSGFLSLKDIIHCLASFEPDVEIPINFKKPDNTVDEKQIEKAQLKVEHLVKKLSKIKQIIKVDVAIDQQKYTNQKTASFRTNIHIDIPGTNITANAESKQYLDSVQDALALAEKQFMRSSKITHHKSQASPV